MTVDDIRKMVNAVDPKAKHYYTALDGQSYTVWRETQRKYLAADDGYVERSWRFRIIRYTQDEYDDMPEKIEDALCADPRVAFDYRVNVDQDTGYVMHEFECEAM